MVVLQEMQDLNAGLSYFLNVQQGSPLPPNYLIDGPVDPVTRLIHKAPYGGLPP